MMHYLEASLRVLLVGLVLGAGLPALFAIGVRTYSGGGDGAVGGPNPVVKGLGLLLIAFVAVVIVVAILWITRNTIHHHFGVDLFPFIKKK